MGRFRTHGETLRGDYARMELRLRGELRLEIRDELRLVSGDPCAKMQWTVGRFCSLVFLKYRLRLVGWPKGIAFANLSKAATGMDRILLFYLAWRTGELEFVPVTQAEYNEAKRNPASAAPTQRHAGVRPKLGRSDIKKRRARPTVDTLRFPPRYIRNGPKSFKWVSSLAEALAALP
ncbi:hypothetical protein VTO73DRAFT_11497 [Trametes versicolor]